MMQEDDVIGVLNSKDIAQLLPLGDRILIEASSIELILSGPDRFCIELLCRH